ncbi:hypothetical protein HanXRQr2_Chr02g0058711 [Helianthus annuus]|uniref:Uncharacterized protein n=1 Tax=Helianthus annuus TaxID=4232 RepID=A0A9K3NZ36_HELAN|nr:hypothetical protein HanXRQr2_Chr02g0058711 [Helianthus annuus]
MLGETYNQTLNERTQINIKVHEHKRTHYQTFTNINERTQPLFMFVHLTLQKKFFVRVRSYIKRTNINELPAERFMNCNVAFVYSPGYNVQTTRTIHVLLEKVGD